MEEEQGKRKTFVEVSHFVIGAFPGMLWCSELLFLKSSSGYIRYNVLSAFTVKATDLVKVINDAFINSDSIVE
jgi:hypothetical protein